MVSASAALCTLAVLALVAADGARGAADRSGSCTLFATGAGVEVLVTGGGAPSFCATSMHAWNAALADPAQCLAKGGEYGCGYLAGGRWFVRRGLFSHGPLSRLPAVTARDPYLRRFRALQLVGGRIEWLRCMWHRADTRAVVYDVAAHVEGREICADFHADRWP